jgi:hypothetical protein
VPSIATAEISPKPKAQSQTFVDQGGLQRRRHDEVVSVDSDDDLIGQGFFGHNTLALRI